MHTFFEEIHREISDSRLLTYSFPPMLKMKSISWALHWRLNAQNSWILGSGAESAHVQFNLISTDTESFLPRFPQFEWPIRPCPGEMFSVFLTSICWTIPRKVSGWANPIGLKILEKRIRWVNYWLRNNSSHLTRYLHLPEEAVYALAAKNPVSKHPFTIGRLVPTTVTHFIEPVLDKEHPCKVNRPSRVIGTWPRQKYGIVAIVLDIWRKSVLIMIFVFVSHDMLSRLVILAWLGPS